MLRVYFPTKVSTGQTSVDMTHHGCQRIPEESPNLNPCKKKHNQNQGSYFSAAKSCCFWAYRMFFSTGPLLGDGEIPFFPQACSGMYRGYSNETVYMPFLLHCREESGPELFSEFFGSLFAGMSLFKGGGAFKYATPTSTIKSGTKPLLPPLSPHSAAGINYAHFLHDITWGTPDVFHGSSLDHLVLSWNWGHNSKLS